MIAALRLIALPGTYGALWGNTAGAGACLALYLAMGKPIAGAAAVSIHLCFTAAGFIAGACKDV